VTGSVQRSTVNCRPSSVDRSMSASGAAIGNGFPFSVFRFRFSVCHPHGVCRFALAPAPRLRRTGRRLASPILQFPLVPGAPGVRGVAGNVGGDGDLSSVALPSLKLWRTGWRRRISAFLHSYSHSCIVLIHGGCSFVLENDDVYVEEIDRDDWKRND
jgi:hypothetical protein